MLLVTEETLRDSTALLLELVRLRDQGRIGPLYAAHFEHGIRGRESRDDLDFSRDLCLRLGVPLFSESADVPGYAAGEGLSLETAARQLRYGFLRRLKAALGADCIALGHHRDDQAETVLLHLVRGSGMTGLSDLVRPLLGVGRADILAYLAERDQPWRLDRTNLSPDQTRSRLRQQVMGPLSAINPRVVEHIAACADRLRSEDEFLDGLAQKALEEARGSRKALTALPPVLQKRAALLLLREVTDDFTEADVSRLTDLFSLPSGRTAPLRGHLLARADGDRLTIGPVEAEEDFFAELTVGQPAVTPWGVYEAQWVQEAPIPCPAREAYVDGVDRKMGHDARRTPIVLDGEGPVFIPGGTVADRVKIGQNTERVIHIIFTKGEESHEELGH